MGIIDQGKSILDVQHLTKTISLYERFKSNPEGKFILIDKSKASELAKAIDCKYQEMEDDLNKQKEINLYLNESLDEKMRVLKSELNEALEIIQDLNSICKDENNFHFRTDSGIRASEFLKRNDK